MYRESLALSRQLVERLGGTPEALRDLSVSLEQRRPGRRARGDWSQAESVVPREPGPEPPARRSAGWHARGAARPVGLPEQPRPQRRAGAGDWPQAESAYRESLALSRQLVERLGGTPEALRDLSVSLDNVGQVARRKGDWRAGRERVPRKPGPETPARRAARRHARGAARPVGGAGQRRPRGQAQATGRRPSTVYARAWRSSRQLVAQHGGTPEALRDLSVSLDNVGRVAQAQGDWAQAESVYRESLALSASWSNGWAARRSRCATCRCRSTTSATSRRRRATGRRPRRRTAKAWT